MDYESFNENEWPVIGPVEIQAPPPPKHVEAPTPLLQQPPLPPSMRDPRIIHPTPPFVPSMQPSMRPELAPMRPRVPSPMATFADPRRGSAVMAGMGAPASEEGHTLGLSFLLTGVGTAIGATYAGLYGGVGGGLAGGAALNLMRAYKHATKGTAEDDKEATVSATYGVLALAASAYFIYKGHSKKHPGRASPGAAEANPEGDE